MLLIIMIHTFPTWKSSRISTYPEANLYVDEYKKFRNINRMSIRHRQLRDDLGTD